MFWIPTDLKFIVLMPIVLARHFRILGQGKKKTFASAAHELGARSLLHVSATSMTTSVGARDNGVGNTKWI